MKLTYRCLEDPLLHLFRTTSRYWSISQIYRLSIVSKGSSSTMLFPILVSVKLLLLQVRNFLIGRVPSLNFLSTFLDPTGPPQNKLPNVGVFEPVCLFLKFLIESAVEIDTSLLQIMLISKAWASLNFVSSSLYSLKGV